MRWVKAFCHVIDLTNGWAGKAVSLLAIPMMVIITIEVILRYVFNSPTLWAWDINTQLLAAIGVVGAGYVLLNKKHVMVDVVVGRFPPRVRAIIDLVTSGFFFFGFGILFQQGLFNAEFSIAQRETMSTVWKPPIYPLHVAIVIGIFLLLLQGLVKFIRDLGVAWSGKDQLS